MVVSNVGSMEVTYSVGVAQALKQLDLLNKKMDSVLDKTEKQTESEKKQIIADKKRSKSINALKKSWVLMGAAGTAALYGLIRASSYASIYTSQFSASVQQLANHILEETGLNKAIEDFLSEFQLFVDKIDAGDSIVQTLLDSLKELKDWFEEQSALTKFVVILGLIILAGSTIIGVFGAIAIAGSALSGGWVVLGGIGALLYAKFIKISGAMAKIVAWFSVGSTGALIMAAAIGVLIGGIVVWLMQKVGILDWFSTLGTKFREWNSWIKDIIEIIASPMALLGASIIDVVNGDLGFPLLIGGLEKVYNTITRLINRVKELINWILRIPSKVSWGGGSSGGEGFGGSWGTSISPGSMPGGGDYSSHQFGGYIKENQLSLLHKGEYVVPKGGALMGESSSGGNTYNIAPVINISSTGSNGDLSRQVSKAIADEIKRMTKI